VRLPLFNQNGPGAGETLIDHPDRQVLELGVGITPNTSGPCIGGLTQVQDCDEWGNCSTVNKPCKGEGTWGMVAYPRF